MDRALMLIDDGFGDCESEPGVSLPAGARFFRTEKPFEDMREALGRDSLAGIGDRENAEVGF